MDYCTLWVRKTGHVGNYQVQGVACTVLVHARGAPSGRTADASSALYSRALWVSDLSMASRRSRKTARAPRTFQELIFALQEYWSARGCVILQPYDMEVGAGTFHTATFLRAVGPEPW